MKAVAPPPRFTVCSFNIECESEDGEGRTRRSRNPCAGQPDTMRVRKRRPPPHHTVHTPRPTSPIQTPDPSASTREQCNFAPPPFEVLPTNDANI